MPVESWLFFLATSLILINNLCCLGFDFDFDDKLDNIIMAALRQREQEQDVSFQPWMALLQLRVKGAVLDQHCSAVLILHPTLNFAQSIKANRSDILLTTRECVSKKRLLKSTDELMVLLGEFADVHVAVKSMILNKYIAMIKLERPVDFKEDIQPLPIMNIPLHKVRNCHSYVESWAEQNITGKHISRRKVRRAGLTEIRDKDDFIEGDWQGERNLSTGTPLICEYENTAVIVGIYNRRGLGPVHNYSFSSVLYNLQWMVDSSMKMDQQSDSFYYDDLSDSIVIPKPSADDFDDSHKETIKEYGREFTSPLPFELRPINHDLIFNGQTDLDDLVQEKGFHFADVINYTVVFTLKQCLMACLAAVPECRAVNYVYGNNWCVFLASAHRREDNVFVKLQDFYKRNPESLHIYFSTGPKSNPPGYTHQNDGVGKQLPTGIEPRFRIKGERIVGGRVANKFAYPWMVDLAYCGASLIESDLKNDRNLLESDLIITAAHCVVTEKLSKRSPGSQTVILGSSRKGVLDSTEQWRRGIKIVSHSNFQWGKNYTDDIAIIQLDHPVQYNNYIGPLKLPDANSSATSLSNCKAIGWGRTLANVKNSRSVYLKEILLQANACTRKNVVGHFFCAEDIGPSKGNACHGDSGGPFFCSRSLKDGRSVSTLLGINAFVDNPKTCGGKAGFSDVPLLLNWIRDAKQWMETMPNGKHGSFP